MGGQENQGSSGLGGLDRRQLALACGVCVLAAALLLVALNLALRSDLRADYRTLHREIDDYRQKHDNFERWYSEHGSTPSPAEPGASES